MAAVPTDPIDELSHDHRHLSELVREVRALLASPVVGDAERAELADAVGRVRDELLVHFAREEEGLFPFVMSRVADLRARVETLRAGHDSVCGAVSRLQYALGHPGAKAPTTADAPQAWRDAFARFEGLYGVHAREEMSLLREVSTKLDPAARADLRALLEGL
jgi:iron-sulfur cluster repair protein YtfE (RIC family)